MRRYIRSLIIATVMTVALTGGAAASGPGHQHTNTFCDCVGIHMSKNSPGGGVGAELKGLSGADIAAAIADCDIDEGIGFSD